MDPTQMQAEMNLARGHAERYLSAILEAHRAILAAGLPEAVDPRGENGTLPLAVRVLVQAMNSDGGSVLRPVQAAARHVRELSLALDEEREAHEATADERDQLKAQLAEAEQEAVLVARLREEKIADLCARGTRLDEEHQDLLTTTAFAGEKMTEARRELALEKKNAERLLAERDAALHDRDTAREQLQRSEARLTEALLRSVPPAAPGVSSKDNPAAGPARMSCGHPAPVYWLFEDGSGPRFACLLCEIAELRRKLALELQIGANSWKEENTARLAAEAELEDLKSRATVEPTPAPPTELAATDLRERLTLLERQHRELARTAPEALQRTTVVLNRRLNIAESRLADLGETAREMAVSPHPPEAAGALFSLEAQAKFLARHPAMKEAKDG